MKEKILKKLKEIVKAKHELMYEFANEESVIPPKRYELENLDTQLQVMVTLLLEELRLEE